MSRRGLSFSSAAHVCAASACNRTRNALGRLFLLDMLLGNGDRLPCEELGWRGNPHNALFCTAGPAAGRLIAIDSAVQRRPPGSAGLNDSA